MFADLNNRIQRRVKKLWRAITESLSGAALAAIETVQPGEAATALFRLRSKYNNRSTGSRLMALRSIIHDKKGSTDVLSYISKKANTLAARFPEPPTLQELEVLGIVSGLGPAEQQVVLPLLAEAGSWRETLGNERIWGGVHEALRPYDRCFLIVIAPLNDVTVERVKNALVNRETLNKAAREELTTANMVPVVDEQ